jgi:hypothetical protein
VDELQDELVRIGLTSLAGYGFALAGGYALQAHGLVDRMSEDVDLFTDRWDTDQFGRAVEAVVDAYQRHGLEVAVVRRADTFARMRVHDPETGRLGEVDLAADYRGHEPDTLTIGPVLAEADAVASKVATVFSRGYARDYLDLAAILASGRFAKDELLEMARQVDAGFTDQGFAEALAAVDRLPDDEFARYGADPPAIAAVREAMAGWSRGLVGSLGSRDLGHGAPQPRMGPRRYGSAIREPSTREPPGPGL